MKKYYKDMRKYDKKHGYTVDTGSKIGNFLLYASADLAYDDYVAEIMNFGYSNMSSVCQSLHENWSEYFGDNLTMTINVINYEPLTNDIDSIVNYYKNEYQTFCYSFSEYDVNKGVTANIECTLKGNDNSLTFKSFVELIYVYYDGWIITEESILNLVEDVALYIDSKLKNG